MVMMLYYDLFSRHLGCLRNRVEMLFGQSIVLWTVLNCESIYIVMTGNIYIYIFMSLVKMQNMNFNKQLFVIFLLIWSENKV